MFLEDVRGLCLGRGIFGKVNLYGGIFHGKCPRECPECVSGSPSPCRITGTALIITIHSLCTVHSYVLSSVSGFIELEAEWFIYQNVQYFISSKKCVVNFTAQLDILCTSAVKPYYAKNDNSPFTCYLCSRVSEFGEPKNLPPSSSDLNLINFGELCNKITSCVFKDSQLPQLRSLVTSWCACPCLRNGR